jgi:hypothetical protein
MKPGLTPEQHLRHTLKWVREGHGLYVGIDPGASGAIGFQVFGDGELIRYNVMDIPVLKVSRSGKKTKSGKKPTKTVFNNPAIVTIFEPFRTYGDRVRVCMEVGPPQINRGGGNSTYTGYRTGWSHGMWPLFLTSMGFRFLPITPSVWKKAFKLVGKEKEDSRQLALQWWPQADLQNKGHHDRAEALLLSDYGRRVFDGHLVEEESDVWPAD